MVEFRLDDAAEARFLDLWDLLKREGLSSLFLDLGYKPHVTLAAAFFPHIVQRNRAEKQWRFWPEIVESAASRVGC